MLFAVAELQKDTSPWTTTIRQVKLEDYSADGATRALHDLWTLQLMLEELIDTLERQVFESTKPLAEK